MATRNLAIEKNAIDKFVAQRKSTPKTPADWAAVHKMAYPTLEVLPEELKSNPGTLSFYQDSGSNKPAAPAAPTITPPTSTLSQTVEGSDLGTIKQTKEQALGRVNDLSNGNEALRILQQAIRTKAGAAETKLGESSIFEQAGVRGFGALSQSLGARQNEINANVTMFQDKIGQMAGTYKNMAENAQFNYKAAADEYNAEVERLQTILDKQETHGRELEILLQKDKLDKEMEAIKHQYKLDELAKVNEYDLGKLAQKTTTADDKIVTIDGKNYVQHPDGTFTQPKLPDAVPSSEKVGKAQDIIAKIDALLTSPDLSKAIGPLSSQVPEWMRSGARNDIDASIDMLVAGMAMENLGLLKGPMSDKDVDFIKDATSGLKKNMSEEGFKARLQELKDKFVEIKNKAEKESTDGTGSTPTKDVKIDSEKLKSAYESAGFSEPYQDMVNKYGEAEVKRTLEKQGITFNSDPGTSQNYLGSLSKKYESGGNPGAIGYDSTGGWSYGTYQLAHDNAKKFVQQSDYADEFKGLAFNSDAWKNKWREVARKDPEGFDAAQHDFIADTHLEPQKQKLSLLGINFDGLDPVLKDVIWSTAVQHGGNNSIVSNVLKNAKPDETEEDIIKKIYAARWNGGKSFAASTPAVRNSVKRRFFGSDGELNNALSRLNSESYG